MKGVKLPSGVYLHSRPQGQGPHQQRGLKHYHALAAVDQAHPNFKEPANRKAYPTAHLERKSRGGQQHGGG